MNIAAVTWCLASSVHSAAVNRFIVMLWRPYDPEQGWPRVCREEVLPTPSLAAAPGPLLWLP